jgi:hypothetical protein
MPLASSTMRNKITVFLVSFLLAAGILQAQTENSPYSRYGLGDMLPSQNLMSRGIGGVSAAYADIISVNFANPASYSRLKRATLDLGVELDSRSLSVINPPRRYTSASPSISYVQLGVPLSQSRNWGMVFGLKPISRINYKIERSERLAAIDSVHTIFEGNGGTYEVYTGTGFAVKNFALGFNVGYRFGNKEYTTRRIFIPDSAFKVYYGSEHSSRSNFGGLFVSGGIQYNVRLSKKSILRVGATANLQRTYNGNLNQRVMTYQETQTGIDSIDVAQNSETSGDIIYPASYTAGVMFYSGDKWLIGADLTQTKWSDYRFFGAKDDVYDSWKLHVGGQILPNLTGAKSYWGRVTYRGGFFLGKDYVKIGDNQLPVWGATIGFGFPMRPPTYTNQYSIINTSIEFGRRGNATNLVRENFLRIGIGLTLSDLWFIKRKYD